MIYINPKALNIPIDWRESVKSLKAELLKKQKNERTAYINSKRELTWGHPKILEALRGPVGNKCWYTEVDLTGADPNIDHFRPKGNIKEIDVDGLVATKIECNGYWWLAFDYENFRLSSMHSNQRRVDVNTNGGKWDFFPVDGPRAKEGTALTIINENVLPLDPCSATDVSLIWFEPDGKPGFKDWRPQPSQIEIRRLKVTTWLYHLDKIELATKRANAMEEIRTSLKRADAFYQLWEREGFLPDRQERLHFDNALADIKANIEDKSPFAGAKRCVIHVSKSEYLWMNDYF